MAIQPAEPLAVLVGRRLGPPPGRAGDRSARSWWHCPFHKDANPSFCVGPDATRFHCFGCGAHGDAVDFLRVRDPALGFAEARAMVEGRPAPARPRRPVEMKRPAGWQAFARRLVAEAEETLWSPRGASARAYLAGRGLTEATIRSARLGLRGRDERVPGVFPGEPVRAPAGIVIPWFEGDEIAMINVRRRGSEPKYLAVKGSRRGLPYPARPALRPGTPLAIVEGEFEALLLGQELDGRVASVTFGSAGDRPGGLALGGLLAASPWFVATDADAAGDRAALAWLAMSARCRRVRPPGPFKDWTEAAQGGVPLRRWWSDVLAGVEGPRLFTWEELAHPPGRSLEGIVADAPDPARRRAALEALRGLTGDAAEGPAPSVSGPGRDGIAPDGERG
jgi:hypothetical protein